MIEVKVDTLDQLDQRLLALGNRIRVTWTGDKPIVLQMKQWKPMASRSQQNLYWEWMVVLGKAFNQDKNDMHDLMRHKFLGYEEKVIGDDVIRRLKSTKASEIEKPDMAHYMNQIDVWASETMGIYLPVPEMNEYAKYREAMQ